MNQTKSRSGVMAAAQTLFVNVYIQGINMMTGIITARALHAQGRGEQAAMTLWPMFFASLFTLGLPNAIIYSLRKSEEQHRRLFSAALTMGALLGVVGALTGIFYLPTHLTKYSPEVLLQARLILLITPLTLVSLIMVATLQARHEFVIHNRIRMCSFTFLLSLLVALLLTHRITPFTSSLALTMYEVPGNIWLLVRLCKIYRPQVSKLWEPIHSLLNYGIRSYGINLLGTFSLTIDSFLVVRWLSPNNMGIYTVALSMSRMLNIIQASVVNVLFPRAAARPKEEVLQMTGRATRITTLLTASAGAVTWVLSPYILRLLYGKDFVQAAAIYRILVLEVILGSAIWVMGQAFMALGKPGMVTLLQGVGVALSIPLLYLLIPHFGLTGAALAILGSTIARFIFIMINYPLALNARMPSLIPTSADIRWVLKALKQR